MRHPFFEPEPPLVIGHRGASGELPENTLPAFARALEQGACILETDLQLTADGVVVALHDPLLERTTDGRGPVAEQRFAELRALDAGYRFTPDRGRSFPARGNGIRIPRLEELFEAFPGIRFNIEIKCNAARLIDATLAAIAAARRPELTLLAAAEDATMRALRARLAETSLEPALGASAGDVVAFLRAMHAGGRPPSEPMALQVPPEFAGRPLVTRELLDFAHEHEVQVHVWTINERSQMERLLDLGVDGVMSDFPGVLHELVATRDGGA